MCNIVTLLSLTISVEQHEFAKLEEDFIRSYQLMEQKWKMSSGTKTVAVAQRSPLQSTSELLTVLHCESKNLPVQSQAKLWQMLTCDAMHKRGLCRHVVFVTFVHSVETNKHLFKIFSQSDSPNILVFSHQMGWQHSNGNFPDRGIECTGGMKKNDYKFPPISRFISEMMQDRAIVTMQGEQETPPKLSSDTNFNDLE